MVEQSRQFNVKLHDAFKKHLVKWAKQSGLSAGQIVEFLICQHTPADLIPDPENGGWRFEKIPPTSP